MAKRILHQADVVEVILAALTSAKTFVLRGTRVITSPTAPGATYVQAEAASTKASIDQIRAALTAAGITL